MAIIQTDPRVQAMFDENIAATRRVNVEATAALKADQDRLAAEARDRESRVAAERAEMSQKAEGIGKAEPARKPQWEQRDRSVGEMAFGPEDDDETPAPPPAPAPAAQVYQPPARPAARRPVVQDDDDDDLSGQTWLR